MAVLSVSEVAEKLGLHVARVRQLVEAGDLEARRTGHQWLIDSDALERFKRELRAGGRPFSSRMAWGLLDLATGGNAPWLDRFERSKARRRLAAESLVDLLPRFRRRAELHRLYGHPGVLDRLTGEIVRSGVSAAADHGFDVIGHEEVEGYVGADDFSRLVERFKLRRADGRANVLLRVVDDPWPFAEQSVAPLEVAALDLCEADDDRSRRAGREALSRSRQ